MTTAIDVNRKFSSVMIRETIKPKKKIEKPIIVLESVSITPKNESSEIEEAFWLSTYYRNKINELKTN